MDDWRNQSGFSAPCSCTQGVTKRASIPLATTESRWWESGTLGGRSGAMAGEREREGRMEDERAGRGVEVGRGSNCGQTPALCRKTNGWRGLRCFCLCALPVSPGRGPSFSAGKQERVRTIKRRLKWERGGIKEKKHGQRGKERAREETEKSSSQRYS